MEVKLTELEKAILLAFLILTKSSTGRYIKKDVIVFKFPMQRRKIARYYLDELVKNKLLIKRDESYALTEDGLRRASRLLSEGAILLK